MRSAPRGERGVFSWGAGSIAGLVALADGRLLVGAPGDDQKGDEAGALYVFDRVANRWTQTTKLTASDAADDGGFGLHEHFGFSVALDGDLAIARWGIAYAVGPNYNKAWDAFDPAELAASLARARAELALARSGRMTAAERALIEALAVRFPTDDPAETDVLAHGHSAYADAMVAVLQSFPDDVDLQALTADALLNVTAWALWDPGTGEPAADSRVVQAVHILDTALSGSDGATHPGVLHLYIHAMEMSAHPERALPAADLLRGLVPDAGHLQHMPSHIDVLCGDYRASVLANQAAVRADREFVRDRGPLNFYSLYRAHDLHFVVYSAMFEGQFGTAYDAARELAGQLTPELLAIESPPMADWLEAFVGLDVHVLVRL